jgi:CDP-6-deoxy-D-xylo-4-hexulose-3-dehydrase
MIPKIPLMKNAFSQEAETRKALAQFVLDSPRLSMGEQCERFEKAFAVYLGSVDAILLNSGGSANLALLQALLNLGRLRRGDAIGFSAVTWSTNVMPILQLGMTPVPVDCEPSTLNCMSLQLEQRLDDTPLKAFFVTNALGLAGDLDKVRQVCSSRNIILLEDNCESLGTTLAGRKTGTFGLAGTHSFYVAHHMSTIEGGMICTDDEELAEMLRIVRANGWDRNLTPRQQQRLRAQHHLPNEMAAKYAFYDLGYNLRPTEIAGFLGQMQLAHLDANNRRRFEIHVRLNRSLCGNPNFVQLDCRHLDFLSPFAFVVLCRSPALKERYAASFGDAGVELRPVIAGNMQRQPFFARYVGRSYDLPGADFIHDCGFYFGNYPELTESDLSTLERCLQR